MWLISLTAVRGGTFLQRDWTGILHKFPTSLAGQRFDKEPGPPLQVATVLEGLVSGAGAVFGCAGLAATARYGRAWEEAGGDSGRRRGRADSPSPLERLWPSPGLFFFFARARVCVRQTDVFQTDGVRRENLTVAVINQGRRARSWSSLRRGQAWRKLLRRETAGLMGEAGQSVMRMETVRAVFEGRF